jgi:WD40 repeat protein
MTRTETILTRDSVPVSIDTNGSGIISAHEDGQIRLWDRRDPTKPTNTYKAHSKWANCVRFGKAPHVFATGSYDHTVKIWDSRCSFPLSNIQAHEEKVLSLEWVDEKEVVSGGSDSAIHLYGANL